MDSGAIDWVTPASTAPDVPLEETEASREGMYYIAANGTKVPNHGQKRIQGTTNGTDMVNCIMQVADVKKTLGAVNRIADAGNTVVFSKKGSYIQNEKTGQKTDIESKNGRYTFKIYRRKPKAKVVHAQAPVTVKNMFGMFGPDGVDDIQEESFRRLDQYM